MVGSYTHGGNSKSILKTLADTTRSCAQGDTVGISIHEWHSSVLWTGNTAGTVVTRIEGLEWTYIH